MQPLEPRQPDGTGLACGFFEFRSGLDGLLADALPDYSAIARQRRALPRAACSS